MALQHRYNTWTACQYAKYFTKTPKDRSRLIELYETGKDTSRLYSLISTFKDIDLKKLLTMHGKTIAMLKTGSRRTMQNMLRWRAIRTH